MNPIHYYNQNGQASFPYLSNLYLNGVNAPPPDPLLSQALLTAAVSQNVLAHSSPLGFLAPYPTNTLGALSMGAAIPSLFPPNFPLPVMSPPSVFRNVMNPFASPAQFLPPNTPILSAPFASPVVPQLISFNDPVQNPVAGLLMPQPALSDSTTVDTPFTSPVRGQVDYDYENYEEVRDAFCSDFFTDFPSRKSFAPKNLQSIDHPKYKALLKNLENVSGDQDTFNENLQRISWCLKGRFRLKRNSQNPKRVREDDSLAPQRQKRKKFCALQSFLDLKDDPHLPDEPEFQFQTYEQIRNAFSDDFFKDPANTQDITQETLIKTTQPLQCRALLKNLLRISGKNRDQSDVYLRRFAQFVRGRWKTILKGREETGNVNFIPKKPQLMERDLGGASKLEALRSEEFNPKGQVVPFPTYESICQSFIEAFFKNCPNFSFKEKKIYEITDPACRNLLIQLVQLSKNAASTRKSVANLLDRIRQTRHRCNKKAASLTVGLNALICAATHIDQRNSGSSSDQGLHS